MWVPHAPTGSVRGRVDFSSAILRRLGPPPLPFHDFTRELVDPCLVTTSLAGGPYADFACGAFLRFPRKIKCFTTTHLSRRLTQNERLLHTPSCPEVGFRRNDIEPLYRGG